ncbi:hypothetical protein RRG08_056420 [Elysia crispata]|uniref:Uncharacterized protein n=1 Tax=Elysia crispata TaxID=231223 RepID=A0AAE0ZYU0_9GAST|nr:hypothetical protein RRG08_056420 [Elysia crispata]
MFGYKGILLIFGIFLAYQTQSVRLKQVLCVITDPIALISSNQEKATFDLVSLAIVLCSLLSVDPIIVSEACKKKLWLLPGQSPHMNCGAARGGP